MKTSKNLTTAGDSIISDNASWTFGGDVAKHFGNHVQKSVPFYHEGHDH